MAFGVSAVSRCLSALAPILLPSGAGLPGADEARVGQRLTERMSSWDPTMSRRVRSLILAFELGPVASRHRRTFSRLGHDEQVAWVEGLYRSKVAWRRLHLAALKQFVFLEWASTPEAEEALGYDYTCRRDGEVHGAARLVVPAPEVHRPRPEPADYVRPGPATASRAIPMELTSKRTFGSPERPPLQVETMGGRASHRVTADVVVIGSGAGGAVVAATLAERGVDVVVLEEGPHVTTDEFRGPMFDRFQRFCRDGGMTQVWGNPPIPLPLGRVVGGTTVVNSGTCFRAPARVLARWESEFGVEGASPDALVGHYSEIEDFLDVRPVPWDLLGPNGRAAHDGAVALGFSGGPLLRNIKDCHGCGQCAFGCPTDAKQAMHISYLPRATHAGARVFARARVRRIVHERGRAVGVDATIPGGGTMQVRAGHVVVCAGAVHTPVLLERSGVPDPSRQTGRNLRIHPATGVGAFFDDDVVNWKGTLQSYYIDQFFDSHELMFEATTTVPSIGAGSIPGIGADAVAQLSLFRKLATLGFYVSDTSKGRVRPTRSGDAFVTYRMNDLDAHRMGIGIVIAAEVLLAAGAKTVYPGLPGIDALSAQEDLERIRSRRVKPEHLRLTAFHPMGTTRMGADPATCVVSPFGAHHAVQNLWVADASTFPSCVAVNPQMTIMAFAKRTAETIAAA